MNKQRRGGILRISREFMIGFFSDLISGKKRLSNKNLRLIGMTRLNDDIPFLSYSYDFVFTADDLPIIPEGCNPNTDFLGIEKVENRKSCYKLIPK